jgi:hypothetical protein
MEIKQGEILFPDFADFLKFVIALDLSNQIKFSRPITDLTGKVMIREGILARQSMIERLRDMEGQYTLPLAIEITNDIYARIADFLADQVMQVSEKMEYGFVKRLLDSVDRNHRAFVRNTFRHRSLALLSYRITQQNGKFFEHCSLLGLLSLGVILQQNLRLPLIHRHAFIAGYAALLGLAGSGGWRTAPVGDEDQRRRLEKSAVLADRLRLPAGIGTLIRSSFFSIDQPTMVKPTVDARSTAASGGPGADREGDAADEEFLPEESELMGAGDGAPEKVDNTTMSLLMEALKIARFAYQTLTSPVEPTHAGEELIHRLAYNTGRGYFDSRLVGGALSRFREHEQTMRHLMEIAKLESQCLHGNHAWAYPKPRATQILCRGNVAHCPHYRGGWKFHLLEEQAAFGRVGGVLPAGSYDKCAFEDKLPAPAELTRKAPETSVSH